ncbi:MAG: hypothetical protein JO345_35300 [Streptosporangiaceae bacterium]|nr:hypothetical protein [Streptosporangiaceae bacterium]
MRPRSIGFGIAVGFVAVLGFASPARASIGVGVQADPVRLGVTAHPGGSYSLPSLFVVNTGTEPEAISVQVKRLSSGPGQAIPASWIRIGSIGEQIQPRQQVLIPLQLSTPGDARPGSYRSDIVVTGSSAAAGSAAGGVRFGAAAATGLEFKIVPGATSSGWLGLPAWKWWLSALVVLLALVVFGIRHTGLRVRIETKSTGGRYGA